MATRRTQGGTYYNSERGFMLCVTALVCLLPTVTSGVGYIQTTRMSWWEAREHCREDYNSDLFIPQLKVNTSNMETDTVYWIGALETAQWKWTDGTSLFEHSGYIVRENYTDVEDKNLPGNSLLECYRHCNMYKYIGLSGKRCYCLYGNFITQNLSNVTSTMPCPGNPEDICGNSTLISVYKLDVGLNLENRYDLNCAVATVSSDFWGNWYFALQPEDCMKERHSICFDNRTTQSTACGYFSHGKFETCHEDLCVSCNEDEWCVSNKSCNFVHVTSSNARNLTNLLQPNFQYWVGLYKIITRKWNNGTEVHLQFRTSNENGQKCLAVYYKTERTLTVGWISCDEEHIALCSQQTTLVSTTAQPNVEKSENLTDLVTIVTTSTTTTSKSILSPQTGSLTETENNRYVYLGVSIGCLLVTLVLFSITMIVWKRQELLCFQKPQKKAARFITATENVSYEVDTIMGTIPASTFPSQQSTATSADKINYENVENGLPQSTTLNRDAGYVSPKKSSGQINAEKRENIDDYDTTSPKENFEDTNHCYNHLGGGNDDVYDTAGSTTEGNTRNSTYNHVDSTNIQDEGIDKEQPLIENEGKTVDYYNMESTANGDYKNTNFSSKEQHGSFAVNEECKDVYTLAKAI